MIIIIFIIALIIGVPVMSVLGLSTIIPMQIQNNLPHIMIPQALFSGLDQFVLVAVTGFIFAGMIMEKCGITDGLLDFSREAVGRLTGGYAILTVVMSTFFAALTGAGPACTAAVGGMTIPLMTKAGYKKDFAGGVAAAAGSLGIMIPPSNPMIVYALLAGVSVGDMFIAGILPGLMIAFLLCVTCIIIARKRNYVGTGEPFSFKKLLKVTWGAKWGILAPVMILGGIYGGFVTPTESAIVAIIYAIIVGICNGKLKLSHVIDALKRTAIMSGSIMAIVGMSTAFGRVLTVNRIPQTVGQAMLTLTNNPIVLQIMIILVMIFVGMWMEPISSLVILVPIFMPLVRQLGINPINFGIILTLTTQIAFITPPVAANLYVASSLTGCTLEKISKQAIPFIGALVTALLFVVAFPQIATFLPSLMR